MASSSDKIRALSLDLERKEEDSSDMKEKLADSKKQIQQVQKEVSGLMLLKKLLAFYYRVSCVPTVGCKIIGTPDWQYTKKLQK